MGQYKLRQRSATWAAAGAAVSLFLLLRTAAGAPDTALQLWLLQHNCTVLTCTLAPICQGDLETFNIQPTCDAAKNYIALDVSTGPGSITGPLSKMVTLQKMSFLAMTFANSDFRPLSQLTNLQTLVISDPSDIVVPAALGNIKSLTSLGIFGDQTPGTVIGSIPSSFRNLCHLKELSIENQRVYGTIPWFIRGLKRLTLLSLASNSLSGTIPSFLSRINQVLLFNNFFHGLKPKGSPLCAPYPYGWYANQSDPSQLIETEFAIDNNCLGGNASCLAPDRPEDECIAFCGTGSGGYTTPPCGGHGVCATTINGTNFCICEKAFTRSADDQACVPITVPHSGCNLQSSWSLSNKKYCNSSGLATSSLPCGGGCPRHSACKRLSWCCNRYACVCDRRYKVARWHDNKLVSCSMR